MAKKSPIKPPAKARPTRGRAQAAAAPLPGRAQLLYMLSDSTGNLARHMVAAFVTQFPPGIFVVRERNFLQHDGQITAALAEIEQEPGAVLHAVVEPSLKRVIEEQCTRLGAACRDLTGGLVDFLAQASGVAPEPDLGRLHQVGEEYFGRIKALEYTLEHDDGLGLETLVGADIVLAGVSRTSKTPTSIYLAQIGFKVANISLAIEVQPPEQLHAVRAGHGIGLVIDPGQLAQIRDRRQAGWQMARTSYSDPQLVARELSWSRQLFTKLGWPVLDVTDQAVEETAGRILEALKIVPKSSLAQR